MNPIASVISRIDAIESRFSEAIALSQARATALAKSAGSVASSTATTAASVLPGTSSTDTFATALASAQQAVNDAVTSTLIDSATSGVCALPATDPTTAGTMREAMRQVVASGTATRLQIPGVDVGAKTGTAQFGSGDPLRSHAWVVAWAGPPGELPVIAVAVIVEGQEGLSEQTGGRVAAPIAKAVIEQALQPMPEPPAATTTTTTPGTSTTGGG